MVRGMGSRMNVTPTLMSSLNQLVGMLQDECKHEHLVVVFESGREVCCRDCSGGLLQCDYVGNNHWWRDC